MAFLKKRDNPKELNKMRELFGPSQVDHSIRQAIQMCWMALQENRRTAKELEKQFRRIVDRATKDMHEDAEAFGLSK